MKRREDLDQTANTNLPFHRVSGDKLHLWLRFRSEAPDGLLVWAGEGRGTEGRDRSGGGLLGPPPGDSLTLGLQDGRLALTYNLGSGFAHLTYNNTGRLDDGQWHNVKISRCVMFVLVLTQ